MQQHSRGVHSDSGHPSPVLLYQTLAVPSPLDLMGLAYKLQCAYNALTMHLECTKGPDATGADVYQDVGAGLVQNALAGRVCCCFAYGQTGSGKTHTMSGQYMHHAPCIMHHAPCTIPAYDTAKSVHKDTPPPLLLPICLEVSNSTDGGITLQPADADVTSPLPQA